MSTASSSHTATLLPNGKVLVRGYYSAELYDPALGTWSYTPDLSMSETGAYHTATLLPNGKILVAGGRNSTTDLSDANLYIIY